MFYRGLVINTQMSINIDAKIKKPNGQANQDVLKHFKVYSLYQKIN